MDITHIKAAISRGETIKNKTRLYLAPCFSAYGRDFKIMMRQFSCVTVCVDDENIPEIPLEDPSLFFLFNIDKSKFDSFLDHIQYFRDHKSYVTDYIYGELLYDKLHMLVLSVPEEYRISYRYFLRSKYSRMYNQTQLKELFDINVKDSSGIKEQKLIATEVILKNPERRMVIEDNLMVTLPEDAELDSVWEYKYELFN